MFTQPLLSALPTTPPPPVAIPAQPVEDERPRRIGNRTGGRGGAGSARHHHPARGPQGAPGAQLSSAAGWGRIGNPAGSRPSAEPPGDRRRRARDPPGSRAPLAGCLFPGRSGAGQPVLATGLRRGCPTAGGRPLGGPASLPLPCPDLDQHPALAGGRRFSQIGTAPRGLGTQATGWFPSQSPAGMATLVAMAEPPAAPSASRS